MTSSPADSDAERRTPIRVDTGDELDAVVAEHDLVLVDFHTKGCALC